MLRFAYKQILPQAKFSLRQYYIGQNTVTRFIPLLRSRFL